MINKSQSQWLRANVPLNVKCHQTASIERREIDTCSFVCRCYGMLTMHRTWARTRTGTKLKVQCIMPCRNVHTTLRRGPVVSYCVNLVPCTSLGPVLHAMWINRSLGFNQGVPFCIHYSECKLYICESDFPGAVDHPKNRSRKDGRKDY